MMKNICVLCVFVLLANGCSLLVELTKHLQQLEHHQGHFSFNTTQLSLPKWQMYKNACRCMGNFSRELKTMVSSVTCNPAAQESVCKTIREIRSKLLRNIEQLEHGENSVKTGCFFRNVASSYIEKNKTSIINSYLKFVRHGNEVCQTCKHRSAAHT